MTARRPRRPPKTANLTAHIINPPPPAVPQKKTRSPIGRKPHKPTEKAPWLLTANTRLFDAKSSTEAYAKRREQMADPALPADLRAFRARFGISQIDLAAMLGARVQTISGWELGRKPPVHSKMLRLALLAIAGQQIIIIKRKVKVQGKPIKPPRESDVVKWGGFIPSSTTRRRAKIAKAHLELEWAASVAIDGPLDINAMARPAETDEPDA